jgi:ferredoxin
MNEETIIICESMYRGNTRRLADAMAFAINCRVVSAKEALEMDLTRYKTVGLGSGIYFTSHHPLVVEAAERLNAAQRAFLFSTHGAPTVGRYHSALGEALRKNGVAVLGEFSTRGYDCTGPFILVGGGNKGKPNERDEQKAMRFASRLLPQYAQDLTKVPEGRFVFVNEDCMGCGNCVASCPMRVFELENGKSQPAREEDCIHCSLCQRACPQRAIRVRHGFWQAIQIAKRHANRRSLNG